MKKIQITALSVILFSVILSSCGKDEIVKWEEEKDQALIDAEFIQIHKPALITYNAMLWICRKKANAYLNLTIKILKQS